MFLSDAGKAYWKAVQWIFRYLCVTLNICLNFRTSIAHIVGYVDLYFLWGMFSPLLVVSCLGKALYSPLSLVYNPGLVGCKVAFQGSPKPCISCNEGTYLVERVV